MSEKFIIRIFAVLIITNIITLVLWQKDKKVVIEDDQKINVHEPVALVGEETISYDDWIDSLRDMYGETHLKKMIDNSVVHQLASEENIEVLEKIVDRDLAMLISMQGVMSEAELDKKTKEWREQIIQRYQLELLLTDDIALSELEMRNYYDTYGEQYNFTESIQLSHIILDTFDQANQVLEELESGADFSLLAAEFSIDENTKDQGGYIGFLTRENQLFSEEYFTTSDELQEGEYSNPFQTHEGVAIINVHLKLPAINFTYEEVKPLIKTELLLDELEQPIAADSLYHDLSIEWLYE